MLGSSNRSRLDQRQEAVSQVVWLTGERGLKGGAKGGKPQGFMSRFKVMVWFGAGEMEGWALKCSSRFLDCLKEQQGTFIFG